MTKYLLAIFYSVIAIIFLSVFYVRHVSVQQQYRNEKEAKATVDFAIASVSDKVTHEISGTGDLTDISETFFGCFHILDASHDMKKYVPLLLYITGTHIYIYNEGWSDIPREGDIT